MARVTISDGCWEWTGAKDTSGYGRVGTQAGVRQTHRVFYEWFVGPIADDMQLDHLCRNRGCVRPSHLEQVTLQENTNRSDSTLAVVNRAKTKCPKGHDYSPDNLVKSMLPKRVCLTCQRARAAAWHRKRRQAKQLNVA